MTPPPFEPKPGDEEFEIDPNSPQELPQDCPPPEDVVVYGPEGFQSPGGSGDLATLDVPPFTLGLLVRIEFRQYKGDFALALRDPAVNFEGGHTRSLVDPSGPSEGPVEILVERPEAGPWTLDWTATNALLGGGAVTAVERLACGGAFR